MQLCTLQNYNTTRTSQRCTSVSAYIETTPSAIEIILSSTDFANSSTEGKIINLLRVDSSLTLDKLFHF